jgi:hypothetical protein
MGRNLKLSGTGSFEEIKREEPKLVCVLSVGSYKYYVPFAVLLLIALLNRTYGWTAKAISLKVTQISSGKSDKDREEMQMRRRKFNKLRITQRPYSVQTAH